MYQRFTNCDTWKTPLSISVGISVGISVRTKGFDATKATTHTTLLLDGIWWLSFTGCGQQCCIVRSTEHPGTTQGTQGQNESELVGKYQTLEGDWQWKNCWRRLRTDIGGRLLCRMRSTVDRTEDDWEQNIHLLIMWFFLKVIACDTWYHELLLQKTFLYIYSLLSFRL